MRKGLLVLLLVCCCIPLMTAQNVRHGSQSMVPTGKGFGVPGQAGPDKYSVHQGNGINYHGGPVMKGTPNVYLIWYGDWNTGPKPSDRPKTVKLIKAFITGISGSGYEMINSTYGDNGGDVTGLVNLAGSVTLPTYPKGKSLSDTAIQGIVGKVISSGKFPADTNGIYFVLTTSDVTASSGFCTAYCGWHTHATIGGNDIKYSFVGNPDRCSSACEVQTTSPNGDSGADGMASIIGHELEEAISDPDLSAWWTNSDGYENADKCAWIFGDLLGGSLGNAAYNETFGGRNWLLQMNYENARGGGCANVLGGTLFPPIG